MSSAAVDILYKAECAKREGYSTLKLSGERVDAYTMACIRRVLYPKYPYLAIHSGDTVELTVQLCKN